MPSAEKGQRFGGRQKGTPNKATVEKQRKAAEAIAGELISARAAGRKLAKEHMQDMLPVLVSMVAYYRPAVPGMPENPHGNAKQFERWLVHFMSLCRSLAPYESATFRAVDLRATLPANQVADPMDVMRSLLDDIDGETRRARAERSRKLLEVAPAAAASHSSD